VCGDELEKSSIKCRLLAVGLISWMPIANALDINWDFSVSDQSFTASVDSSSGAPAPTPFTYTSGKWQVNGMLATNSHWVSSILTSPPITGDGTQLILIV
jgi:hypothetical protein